MKRWGLWALCFGLLTPPVWAVTVALDTVFVMPADVGQINVVTALLLDAASEKSGYVFRITETGSLRKVGFRTGTVTTGAIMDVRVETVDAATGFPSGTLWATNTNVSHTIADADDNAWLTTAALTADASVTRGDIVAIVISQPAASFGTLNIARANSTYSDWTYSLDFITGAWAKSTRGPTVAVEYSDGSYPLILGSFPMLTSGARAAYNSGSTPDERGIKFQVLAPVRVAGFWLDMSDPLGGNGTVKLYDSDGSTVLTSVAWDGDIDSSNTTHTDYGLFPSSVSLLANTFYRLTFLPTTASDTARPTFFSVQTAAVMDAYLGGQNFHSTSRTDAGAWTDTTTERDFVGILIDAIDNGVGSSTDLLGVIQ